VYNELSAGQSGRSRLTPRRVRNTLRTGSQERHACLRGHVSRYAGRSISPGKESENAIQSSSITHTISRRAAFENVVWDQGPQP
jgi:hypothetical protein